MTVEPPKQGGLKARALRGTAFTVLAMAGSNVLRLASNLILTRILFPEAFGLMALTQTFIQGLKMLSDTGVGQSIIRSDRGDDPDFLNTAWTVQACRGTLLWLILCVLAYPLALLYQEPLLGWVLPLTGLTLVISGFTTTNAATANRHLALGRLTMVNLGTQAIGLLVTAILAWQLQSVWALAIGTVLGAILTICAQHAILPGIRNRFHWEPTAFWEIFHFGKFLFLSSALGFLINQGDRLVLGRYLTLADFGVFSIGMMLAMLPFTVGKSIIAQVLFPLYRQRPITESEANRRNVFRARRIVLAGALSISAVLAFIGVPLVELLYDPRYHGAGGVVVLVCFALVPQMLIASYSPALLAAGDSKNQFYLVAVGAVLQIGFLFIGLMLGGTFGVILAPAAVNLCLIPLMIRFVKPHKAWDPLGDLVLSLAGFGLTGLACWVYRDALVSLLG